NSPSVSIPTGRTSSVWTTKSGDQGSEETGGPIVSMRLLRAGLLLRATGLDGAPDGADLRGSDVLLVGGPPVRLNAADHLLPGAARHPAAAARDLHLHAEEPTPWRRTMLCNSDGDR